MRFEDEQYVRLYKRDTTTWKMLPWQSRCLLSLVLRKLDRAGILDLGEDRLDALAVHLEVPLEFVEAAMPAILKRKVLVLRDDGILVWPRFIEAQEAKQSDKARQKATRDRARDVAAAVAIGVSDPKTDAAPPSSRPASPSSENVDPCDGSSRGVTVASQEPSNPDASVTRGHTVSPGVTLSLAVNSLAEPTGVDGGVPKPAKLRPLDSGGVGAYEAVDAYAEAIRSATGNGYAFPTQPSARESLCLAINEHSKATTATGAILWMRTALVEWVGAYREQARFTNGWAPAQFLAWVNGGRQKPTANARQAEAPIAPKQRNLAGHQE